MVDGESPGRPEDAGPAQHAPDLRPDFAAATPPAAWSAPAPAAPEPSYYWPFGSETDTPTTSPVPTAAVPARRPRTGAVVGAAALTAVLVGGGAGYGAARLAERAADPPAVVSTAPAAPRTSRPVPLPPAQSTSTVEVARRVLPSTVMIEVGEGTGSGFVLDTSGNIMTNNHVVAAASDGARIGVVFADGRRTTARLVGRSPSYDLAVIKVKASDDLQPVQTGDSGAAQVGEPVVAIGSPLGLPGTVTQGIVSAVNRPLVVSASGSADAPTAYINGIQTDAPINPGNSGGPLVDATARVIGVNSAILTMGSSRGQTGNIGLGFAIPVNQAKVIGTMLINDGHATYPVIGASVRDASGGVELTSVDGGGPARRAGLRTGDLVTRIDDRVVSTSEELIVAVRTHRPGDTITLGYTRGSDDNTARVALGGKEG
jgi:putative serine protease PepD